ncbi:E3 ubiquitin-protein ligase UBR2 isoform X3 [Lacerta agilis]|uniref:E3 ubiquitin-protein ligase UBR2 isoform X3 n=1 Tax=Lacerta agilis TaxID=80427 RepID=UPI00141A3DDB|nr:E3 ubiquitin-protein ligase UBR2 isoform X3 [Lacerta agilis]
MRRRRSSSSSSSAGGEKMAADRETEVPAIDRSLLECSAEETALKWLQTPDLPKEIYKHLAYYVPKIYCRGPNPAPQSEDLLAQQVLLGPMEWYLCGEDPAFGFQKLEQSNKPSHLCGRVFKVGEPTYSCRDCAVDPTCVLCMECFLGSVHREHRYRMTTSGGGGFCDCGDTEAWKEGPYCQKHEHNTSETEEEEDPLVHLTEDMIAKVYNIFAIMFQYAVDILTWEKENDLPPGLETVEKTDTYFCMLFNDEVHTYEQVIYTLQKAVNCTQKEAIGFATTVDRDGRRSVRYGDFQYCDQAKSVIVRSTSRQTKPLKVQVMHSSIVAHQSFGLKLLTWLGNIIGYSDGLRRILCQVGLQEGPEGENSSLVDKLMLSDSKLWKGARSVYHQLFMSSLLMDLKYKKLFAIRFARNYERLQNDYVKDDHDREYSIADLSVQIFTVPSLARMLIIEENLMTTIISTFMDHLRHRDIQGRFQFERYTALQAFKFRRVQSLILDLKYVLISKPVDWSDDLRQKFLDGFDIFLELLKCMQGMDPITRQVGQHIEMEPEWEAAFTLQMKLTHVISMMQDWCALDEKVLIEAYKKSLTTLMQCHSGFTDGEQPIDLNMCGHSVETIRYCVSQEKVSIHLPVSRLLAGLHVLLSKSEVAYKFPEQLPMSELSPPMLIEHPLRCLVLCAQVHAGMWRRNGFSLVNQIYYYHNVKCRREMFDKDIVMLQTGASMMDPNHFLMIMLSRFELYQIFSTPDYGKRFSSENSNKDVVQQNNTLIEEMLYLIIIIVGERFIPGVGQVTATDEIKREIIHQLSIRPMAHSELVKALPEDENKETGMESVIEAVACFKKPGLTGRGLYELKPECAKYFNLYFYHFSRAEQSKAEEAQRKIRRQNREDTALPPPVLPPFCPLFESLINILQCDVMLCIMRTILQWAVEHNGYAWSESMLQRVLHLTGMALQEEKQHIENADEDNVITFTFSQKISRPEENGMDQENPTGEEEAVLALHKCLGRYAGSAFKEMSSGWHLWRSIKAGIMPFLRCSAMFFHYLNGVPVPPELQVSGANQFEHLCSYLSLPNNLVCLFQENSKITDTLVESWCNNDEVKRYLQGQRQAISYPRESNKLIDLPDDYSSLINQASNFSCPKSGGDKSRAPTLCLVCGTMLCSQSYCCQTELEGEDVGACTAHTFICGSGVGIFLRVRECQVLFLAGKTKGCFYAPPYLDDYGETDQGLRRGNPLHLCRERFKKIQKLWQQHSITEEIGHAQEANQTLVGIDWQHL